MTDDQRSVLEAHQPESAQGGIWCVGCGWGQDYAGNGSDESWAQHIVAALAGAAYGTQLWERRVGRTEIPEVRLHLDVEPDGRARVHEAVLVQLLVDAGWERVS